MSKGGGGTTVTKADPWSGQQAYLSDLYSQAQKLTGYYKPIYSDEQTITPAPVSTQDTQHYTQQRLNAAGNRKKGPYGQGTAQQSSIPRYTTGREIIGEEWIPGTGDIQYFQGDTIAGFTPEQIAAQEAISSRAGSGSPLLGASQEYLQDVIKGKYLTPDTNPYLQHYISKGLEQTLPNWDTAAIEAGRYGSEAWGSGRGREMADVTAQVYGPAIEAALARQMEAAGMAPGLAREDYFDMIQLAQVGAEKQAMNQALIDAAREKWEFEQMQPWDRLARYSNLLSGNVGGTSTSTFQ